MSSYKKPLGVLVFVAAILAASYWLSGYRIFQLSQIGIYFIAIMGLSLLTGYNGQISLGHGAFFAIGAYSTAILSQTFGVDALLTVPVAAAICFAAGYLIGLPVTRLEGLYLALATFALAVATPQLLKYQLLEPFTGGVQGVYVTLPDAPQWIQSLLRMSSEQWMLGIVLVTAAVLYLLTLNLVSWKFGRAIIAVKDHPAAAAAMGVNVARCKVNVFATSAAFAGIAGALNTLVVQFVAPDSFTFYVSIAFLVGMVIGGAGSLASPLLGAIFVQLVPNYADQISKSAPWAIYGGLLVVTIYLYPGGCVQLWHRLLSLLARAPKDQADAARNPRAGVGSL
jgi:branched-chain amino acid transport system permease protein